MAERCCRRQAQRSEKGPIAISCSATKEESVWRDGRNDGSAILPETKGAGA